MKKTIILALTICCLIVLFAGCDDVSVNENDSLTTSESPTHETLAQNTKEADDSSNYILFGAYEQDGNLGNGSESIQWIPLYEQDGKILLISRFILGYKEFNDTTIANATSWKNSTLRKWLNNDFLNSAFSSEEQKKIVTTDVQDYKADNVLGDKTSDKVFLLNKDQAFTYFSSDFARSSTSTEYAKSQKIYVTDSYWLINSYTSDLYKYLINSEGRNENNPRVNETEGVRPVIWITKES